MPSANIIGPSDHATYARNTVPKIVLTGYSGTITAELAIFGDNSPLFVGSYQPDFSGRVSVGFEGVYEDALTTHLPSVHENETQYEGLLLFVATVKQDGSAIATFTYYVANAVYLNGTSYEAFAGRRFLTNQPAEKRTDADAPEFLTWHDNQGDWTIKVRFYPKTGGHADYTLYTDTEPGVFSKRVGYGVVIREAGYLASQLNGYYDIIAFNDKDEELMRQRYVLMERSGNEHYYMFVNALGGIDTLICRGACALQPDITFNTGRFDDLLTPIDDSVCNRQWQQATGQIPWRERDWLYELLTAKGEVCRYHAGIDYQENIVVTGGSISMSDDEQLASGAFNYTRAEVVNAIHQAERDGDLHLSVAEEAKEPEDLTTQVVLEFSPSQGGYATEAIAIPATRIYVTVAATSTVYIEINGTLDTEIDPANRMPVVIEVTPGDEVSFNSQEEVGDLAINYYPDETYLASRPEAAQQQTES